eukprot:4399436-Alexandrium_andersonii.AAC.1
MLGRYAAKDGGAEGRGAHRNFGRPVRPGAKLPLQHAMLVPAGRVCLCLVGALQADPTEHFRR